MFEMYDLQLLNRGNACNKQTDYLQDFGDFLIRIWLSIPLNKAKKWACDRLTEVVVLAKKKSSFQMKLILVLAVM